MQKPEARSQKTEGHEIGRSPAAGQHRAPGRALLTTVFWLLASVFFGGCIQERTAPEDPPSIVSAAIDFSPGLAPLPFPALVPPPGLKENSPMGLRGAIVMTGQDPRENNNSLVKNDGLVTVLTRREGKGFFVVRGAHYDLGYGPVDVGSAGTSTPVTFLRPFDGEPKTLSLYQPPLTGGFSPTNPNCDGTQVTFPNGVRVMPKEPGRAKFVFFGDDPVGQLNQGRVEGRGNDSAFPVVISVVVIGDFNNFRLPTANSLEGGLELLDEGSQFCPVVDPPGPNDDVRRPVSGDEKAGDRVFTRYVYNLPPGDLRYAFIINGSPLSIIDPYQEGGTRVRIVTQNEVREFAASIITVK